MSNVENIIPTHGANVWTYVFLVAVGVIPALLAYRQAIRVARLNITTESRQIDAQAYERAKQLYESAIIQLERQIRRLTEQIEQEQDASDALRAQVQELEATIDYLHSELLKAGIIIDHTYHRADRDQIG